MWENKSQKRLMTIRRFFITNPSSLLPIQLGCLYLLSSGCRDRIKMVSLIYRPGVDLSSSEFPIEEILNILRERLGDRFANYEFPPPVFAALEGSFQELNLESGMLRARFPVLGHFLNPFGTLQGGIIAAAVDNTLGPLSILVAPPNVTRELNLTYSHPVHPELEYFDVSAQFIRRDGLHLHFTAEVRDLDQKRLARARAVHYIIES